MTKVPVGVLISGSGTNLQALIDACKHPDYPAEIAVVISNKKSAFGLERAKTAGLATAWLPARPHPSREAHETALTETLKKHRAQWVVCAGYMRVLSPSFVQYLKRTFRGFVLDPENGVTEDKRRRSNFKSRR